MAARFNQRRLSGIEIVAHERARQVYEEGFHRDHDDNHHGGELALAAACYAIPARLRTMTVIDYVPVKWPWERKWWKPSESNRIKELAKAGALICAEIDRLNRIAEYGDIARAAAEADDIAQAQLRKAAGDDNAT